MLLQNIKYRLQSIKGLLCLFWNGSVKSSSHNLPAPLIVSLTSYEPRFATLHLTLRSLLAQKVTADKYILWLCQNDAEKLPKNVKALVEKHPKLVIELCEDLKSYKKLIPTLNQYPDAFVITADDDLYYPPEWIEQLVNFWDGGERTIVVQRVHKITYQSQGVPSSYAHWEKDYRGSEQTSDDFFPTSGAGMLFPPACLPETTKDIALFQRLCPTADDLWIFWMSKLNGNTFKLVEKPYQITTWPTSQRDTLYDINILNGKNDDSIQNLISHFGWPIK